jgi:hypothetical protein
MRQLQQRWLLPLMPLTFLLLLQQRQLCSSRRRSNREAVGPALLLLLLLDKRKTAQTWTACHPLLVLGPPQLQRQLRRLQPISSSSSGMLVAVI